MNIIIPYSLMKMMANSPPPYSMLNPETISDSPSAMSKGVRFASAKHNISHIMDKGIHRNPNHMLSCILMISLKLKDVDKNIKTKINKTKHTS